MKKLFIVGLIGLIGLMDNTSHAQTDWTWLEKLMDEASYKTAYARAEAVYKKTKSSPELLTAAWYMSRIAAEYQEDAYDSAVARYRAILPRLEAPERAVCYAFLGLPDSALLDEELLKKTSSERIRRFCEKEDGDDGGVNLTPTVYDVVVFHLIETDYDIYYQSRKKSREWLQRLVEFHKNDSEELRICLDLLMLDVLEDSYDQPCDEKTLQRYIDKYRGSGNPKVADFYYAMAQYLDRSQRWVEAVNYCDTAIALAPESGGGADCANLKNKICAALIEFAHGEANATAYPGRPSLHRLTYRNMKRIYFSVYPFEGNENAFFKHVPKPLESWQMEVSDDGSHRRNNIYFEVPALAAGRYLLVASPNGKFDGVDCAWLEIHCTEMKVCKVDSVFQLLDAGSGTPIVGQQMNFYRSYRHNDTSCIYSAYTDSDGRVEYKGAEKGSFILKIKRGGYLLSTETYFYGSYSSRRKMRSEVELMTDRPVYRFGDTIRFAALHHENDGVEGQVLAGVRGTFSLLDPNRKVVDTLGFITDDHGLASAFFVIPADALGGSWRLDCRTDDKSEYMSVRVEEYKPPKFMVTIDAKQEGTSEPPAFGRPFTLQGMARAYSGASLAGAQVKYSITRWPYGGDFWRYNYPIYEREAVASDTIEVASDGTFDITFTPQPDSLIDPSIKVNYQFVVVVEVTDLNGETHEAGTDFRIGYENRTLALMGVEGQTTSLPSIAYSLTDINSNPLKGTVKVSVQRLAVAKPLLKHPVYENEGGYVHTLTRELFHEHFPGYYYTYDEVDPGKRKVEWSYDVSHTADGFSQQQTVPLPEKKMKSGVYRIVVNMDDLSDTTYTTLTLPDERHVQSADELVWVDIPVTTCEVGERLTIRYGSAFDDVRVFYTLTGPNGDERDRRWFPAGSSIKRLSIPVDTSLLGGFTVYLTAMKNGVVYRLDRRIDVPFSHKKLDVEIATFRDKLQPGQQEEWTIKVKGNEHSSLVTQRSSLIMTMFDDALTSYGYSQGSWTLYPWRGNRSWRSLNWLYPGISWSSYDAYRNLELQVGYTSDPVMLSLQQGLFHSVPHAWESKGVVRTSAVARGEDGMATTEEQDDSLEKGTLKGTITDEKTREALPFVNVIVKQNGKQVRTASTDFDGVYTIKSIPIGTYDVEVTSVGYNRCMRTGVNVKATGFTVVNVELVPSATALEEVVIVEDKVPVIEIGAAESGQRLAAPKEAIAEMMPGNSVDAVVAAVGGVGYSDGGAMLPVQVRTNLKPYAFFVAGLHTDTAGNATYRFTVPEVLTRWKVKALAYTDDLKSGNIERILVTQKSLMVQPNIPRFLRHGDSNVLMAKVVLTEPMSAPQKVDVTLLLTDAATGDTITLQHCQVTVKDASQVTFPIIVPHNVYVATYQITAVAKGMSDGERGQIPVVSSRQAVTLSQPVYINGAGEKTFALSLPPLNSTAEPHFIGAELVSNPMWLAIKSMPYLKQQENPSTLFLANSLYVNTLANEIIKGLKGLKDLKALCDTANTRLKINEDVKQTLLEATPWLRDAESEVEQRKAIANYFDSTRLAEEFTKLTSQLTTRQNSDGGWSWMPDGGSSPWVTMQVLKRVTKWQSDQVAKSSQTLSHSVTRALQYVDREEQRHYEKYIKPYLKKYKWEPDNIDYLYTRSFYGKGNTEAYKFYYKNALKNYKKYKGLYTQAQLALIFHRHGDKKAARDLIRRLKEKSLQSDEMGIYWRDNRSGWCWYERPIETQALLIQAFREVVPQDTTSIALMQQWLLKQKQATHWGNDRATVEAISALVTPNSPNTLSALKSTTMTLCGVDLSASSEGLEGYRTQRWEGPALDSILALDDSTITLRKNTSGIAWGAVYFQYTDDIDKIPYSESGITLKRTYLGQKNQNILNSPNAFKVGDRIKVRIEISCDRTMEYLELIDGRPSCVEPLSTRAGWNWNQGLRYYVEVKNTATHCYIDRLEKGKYVVEYDVYVTNPGTFLAGPVTMQCMYAPEFRAIAPAQRLTVE